MARAKPDRLLDVEAVEKPKWNGSKALVHFRLTKCPECGEKLVEENFTQLALPMLHGGYGANQETVRVDCVCGWYLTRSTTETNPRRT